MKDECNHKIVLEIYLDKRHLKISHYFCVNCGKESKERFGKQVISELRRNIINELSDRL